MKALSASIVLIVLVVMVSWGTLKHGGPAPPVEAVVSPVVFPSSQSSEPVVLVYVVSRGPFLNVSPVWVNIGNISVLNDSNANSIQWDMISQNGFQFNFSVYVQGDVYLYHYVSNLTQVPVSFHFNSGQTISTQAQVRPWLYNQSSILQEQRQQFMKGYVVVGGIQVREPGTIGSLNVFEVNLGTALPSYPSSVEIGGVSIGPEFFRVLSPPSYLNLSDSLLLFSPSGARLAPYIGK